VTKSLLLGFNEFLDWGLNPARITVETLQSDSTFVAEVGLIAEVLPTEFDAAGRRVVQLITEHRPDVVIVVGMAAGRPGVSLERVALNLNDTNKPDNAGKAPRGSQIIADGPLAYWSTLPLLHLAEKLASQGIPAQITNFAGTFVCNHTFYLARHTIESLDLATPCGLVHIPLMTEQLDETQAKHPSLPAAQLAQAIALCLRASHGV
jgi:pyroglutamyl-peptidase